MSTEIVPFETVALAATAVSVGAIHTLLGPDHYVPFAAMSHAGGWSAAKTLRVTVACGIGHVAGSVALGLVGLAIGVALLKLQFVEAIRGDVAGWMLVAFGAAYLGWGIVAAVRLHGRAHETADAVPAAGVWAPWLLFLVFVFGPCEPLIPLLIYPAAQANGFAVVAVVAAFAAATVGTMVGAVLAMRYGAAAARVPRLERFSHALAGLAILACGLLVKLGL
jgi:sulfite exporter TauE/SafE